MENIDLGTLITGAVCGVGIIELIIWIVVVIRNPGYDFLRPEIVPNVTSNALENPNASRAVVSQPPFRRLRIPRVPLSSNQSSHQDEYAYDKQK